MQKAQIYVNRYELYLDKSVDRDKYSSYSLPTFKNIRVDKKVM